MELKAFLSSPPKVLTYPKSFDLCVPNVLTFRPKSFDLTALKPLSAKASRNAKVFKGLMILKDQHQDDGF
jgi:hypothetical protein